MMKIRDYKGYSIRTIRKKEDEDSDILMISVVDVINAITTSQNPRGYWNTLKHRIGKSRPELLAGIEQHKLPGRNGIIRVTDVAPLADIKKLIQYIPAVRNGGSDLDFYLSDQPDEKKILLPVLRAAYEPGGLKEYYDSLGYEERNCLPRAELEYFRGNFEKAVEIANTYLQSADLYDRGQAANICVLANVAMGRIDEAEEGLAQLTLALNEAWQTDDAELKAVLELMLEAIYAGTNNPDMIQPERIEALLSDVSRDLWPWGWHIYCRRLLATNEFEKVMGIVGVAGSLLEEQSPIQQAYLELIAAIALINMKEIDKAREHLLEGMRLCHPDGIHIVMGDAQLLLPCLINAQLKEKYPEECMRMEQITEGFVNGVNEVRKRMGQKNIPFDLARKERVIACLAARGWKNKEIASFLGYGENTVKKYLSDIYNKLQVSSRKELKKFKL